MTRRERYGSRLLAVIAVLASVSVGLQSAPAEAAPSPVLGHVEGTQIDDTLSQVGSIPRVPAGLTIGGLPLAPIPVAASGLGLPVISPVTGRVYQFFTMNAGDNATRTGVLVRDGATLQVADSFLLPPEVTAVADFAHREGAELAHSYDPAGKRFFFWLEAHNNNAERRILILDEERPRDPAWTKVVPLGTTVAGALGSAALPDTSELVQWALDNVGEISDFVQVSDWEQAWEQWLNDPTQPMPPLLPFDPNDPPDIDPNPPIPSVGVPSVGNLGDPSFIDTGTVAPVPLLFQGLTFIAGKLYVVFAPQLPSDPPQPVLLFELDAGPTRVANAQGNVVDNPDLFDIDWLRPVRGCRSAGPGDFVTSARFHGFVPVMRTEDHFYLPCASSGTAVIVKMAAAEINHLNGAEEVFTGTGSPVGYLVDAAGRRIHMRVHTPLGSAVLTFDTNEDAFVGLQAVSASGGGAVKILAWGLDRDRGRIFTQTPPGTAGVKEFGLGLTSGRFTPVQPPVTYQDLVSTGEGTHLIRVLPYDTLRRRLYLPDRGNAPANQNFLVLHDEPPPLQPPPSDADSLTNDVEEEGGKTGLNFSGNTSGYGARELLVGGLGGLVPNRVTDVGSGGQPAANVYPDRPLCQRADRELVLAQVESAKLDNSVQAATARPAQADGETREDLKRPSRCTEKGTLANENNVNTVLGIVHSNLDNLKRTIKDNCGLCAALIDQVLATVLGEVDEPPQGPKTVDDIYPDQETREQIDRVGQDWPFDDASCRPDALKNSTGADPESPLSPVLGGFSAGVDCSSPTESRASATATPVGTNTIPASGVSLVDDTVNAAKSAGPQLSVGSSSVSARTYRDPNRGMVSEVVSVVKGVTVALPAGGSITIGGIYAEAVTVARGRPGTATTSYKRLAWGVHAVTPSGEVHCELCANDQQLQQLAAGLSAALGERGKVVVPKLDAKLAAGSPRGYQAGVQRDPFVVITNDIVQGDSVKDVPALEIVLFNDSIAWGRQRQIFQFAGAKANSQYGIVCLGGGRAQNGHCVLPPRPPSSLTVSLTDEKFKPLAGGAFTIGSHSCTTGADGRCAMLDVPAGKYVIKQTAAPEGYLAAKDFPVQLSGAGRTVNFVNLKNAAFVVITLHDSKTAGPLPGGLFHVVSDADGNKARGPKDPLVASCTTDSSGACPLVNAQNKPVAHVALDKYVVQQVGAPKGYQVAEPVAFELNKPGEVADLAFTNGSEATAVLSLGGGRSAPAASIIPSGGGGGLFGPLARGLRWFAKNFFQMLLLGASVALFGSPLWQSWRRRMLIFASTRPL